MARKVKPIPKGYRTVTPYLTVPDGARALEFYKKALGAKVRLKLPGPGGKLGHAEIEIGDSLLMLADEFPGMGSRSAKTLGGSPVSLLVYVKNVDKQMKKAIAAGGVQAAPVEDKFYGDRTGAVDDPFGFRWHLATHVEDVSPKDLAKRAKQMAAQAAPPPPSVSP